MLRLCFVMLSCFWLVSAKALPAVVDYVYDGDTFSGRVIVTPDISVGVRVRLINVDTPEIHGQCDAEREMAQNARQALRDMLPSGTQVQLERIKDDKYLGRIDANVILSDGRDVGMVLIERGLGRPYKGGKRRAWCGNK